MQMSDFLNSKAINADIKADTKEGVIKELLDLLINAGAVKGKDKLFKILMNREALGSTGIGQGVGIPHGKTDGINNLVAALGISKKGIDFDSLDGEPAHIIFLLLAPENTAGPHLKALARISRLLKDKFLRDRLIKSKTPKEVMDIINQEDRNTH